MTRSLPLGARRAFMIALWAVALAVVVMPGVAASQEAPATTAAVTPETAPAADAPVTTVAEAPAVPTTTPIVTESEGGSLIQLGLGVVFLLGGLALLVAVLSRTAPRPPEMADDGSWSDEAAEPARSSLLGSFTSRFSRQDESEGPVAAETGPGDWAAATSAASSDPAPSGQPREVHLPRIDELHSSIVGRAESTLASRGWDTSLAGRLDQAGMTLRPAEWLVTMIGSCAVAFIAFTALLGPIGGILAVVATYIGFRIYLSMRADRRRAAFADQLPETLQLLAGSMRAGLSLQQSLDSVAADSPSPTGPEIGRALTENRLGRDLSRSLKDTAERMDSDDFRWVTNAIEIHREVGGDLAEILDRVVATVRARNRVRGQIKSLSAEGRMSGIILIALPPAMFLLISVTNPEYQRELTGRPLGWLLIAVATTMLVVGGLWMRRITRLVF
ncbi:MAG: type II secretion system F family protein [Actinomycetota bacterium]|nr:type II secretion system F family protein [Actinomycetota bacterium]